MSNKVEYLVVDTSAFIKNTQLQDIGVNLITIPEVVDEVKSKRQLRRLVVLPYELQIKEAAPEDVAFVTQFSKKTGDYPCLSATDLKVMALTYRLEREHVGEEHLKSVPDTDRSVHLIDHSLAKPTDTVGFYLPKEGEPDELEEGDGEDEEEEEEEIDTEGSYENTDEDIDNGEEEKRNKAVEEKLCRDLSGGLDTNAWEDAEREDCSDADQDQDRDQEPIVDPTEILKRVNSDDDKESGISEEEEEEEADDNTRGWITPGNVFKAKKKMAGVQLEEKPVTVACLTTDFAMQNVLKQIGMSVVTLDGLVIREVKTYIFRCYACFKTTSIMTKVFCPNCGNKTLKRVAVTVDADGKQQVHINYRRPLTARGKRFSLPKPQGGKHGINPVLCEDQRLPQQRLTKLARATNNPMDPDYIAGVSPFVMRDVNSKSAMLGLHRKGEFKYWMRRNPNEVCKHRKKK